MSWVAGPYHIVASVLVVSGVAKIARPARSAATLQLLRLPGVAARPVGVGEVLLGTGALCGLPVAPLIAVAYVIFAGTAAVARRRGLADCGCFGTTNAPPTTLHVWVNLAAAVIAVAAMRSGEVSVISGMGERPGAGLLYLAAVGTGAALMTALYTVGAEVAALTKAASAR